MTATVDSRVDLAGIPLRNPVLTASGTFGYGTEFAPFLDLRRIGGFVAKSLTLEPRLGNPPPRIAEAPSGMLNAISLENVGVDAFVREKLPALPEGVTVIASVFETEIDRYAEVAKRLTGVPRVAGLEVNASCPHVKSGGIEFGQDPQVLGALVRAVRNATTAAAARQALTQRHRHRRDGPGLRGRGGRRPLADQRRAGPRGGRRDGAGRFSSNVLGGLSGPAIRPIALRMVWQASRGGDDADLRDRRHRAAPRTRSNSCSAGPPRSRWGPGTTSSRPNRRGHRRRNRRLRRSATASRGWRI